MVRIYRLCNIYRLPVTGYWETYVGGRFWKADTLEGIKQIIRDNS